VEYFPAVEPDTGNELFWKLYEGLPVAVDGRLTMTDAPGLGLSLRREVVADLEVGSMRLTSDSPVLERDETKLIHNPIEMR
jgi:hypothetical protein